MSFDPRSRMISFRLTSEEFDRCRQLCFSRGLRSVSEMARTAINLLLQEPEKMPQETLEGRVAEIEARLQIVALELKQLNRGIAPRETVAVSSFSANAQTTSD